MPIDSTINDIICPRCKTKSCEEDNEHDNRLFWTSNTDGAEVCRACIWKEDEEEDCCLKCGSDEAPHGDHTGKYCARCWDNATFCAECEAVVWMDECFVDEETGDCLCEACEKKEESK